MRLGLKVRRLRRRVLHELMAQHCCMLANTGFEELCHLNPRFNALREALFSHAALSLAREQLTPDAVAKLNEAIDEFCALLVPHFLSSPAFRALEYLIRHFK